MTLRTASSPKNLVNALVRRNRRNGTMHVDVNADFVGRRPSGDPRLDLAFADRNFR